MSDWHQAIRQRVVDCGIASDKIVVIYQRDLQDYEVLISGVGADVDPLILTCIARLQREGIIIVFDSAEGWTALQAAYQAEFAAVDKVALEETARGWLEERGLFDSRPIFDPRRHTREQYMREIARFCRLPEGTVYVTDDRAYFHSMSDAANRWPEDSVMSLIYLLSLDQEGNAIVGGLGFSSQTPSLGE